jgi:hypothetical protein
MRMCRGTRAWTCSRRTSATPICSAIAPGPDCGRSGTISRTLLKVGPHCRPQRRPVTDANAHGTGLGECGGHGARYVADEGESDKTAPLMSHDFGAFLGRQKALEPLYRRVELGIERRMPCAIFPLRLRPRFCSPHWHFLVSPEPPISRSVLLSTGRLPPVMIFHPTVERYRQRTGLRHPSMDRPRPMDRKQTTGRRPSTARRQATIHHLHTESRIPTRRRAPTCDLQWRRDPSPRSAGARWSLAAGIWHPCKASRTSPSAVTTTWKAIARVSNSSTVIASPTLARGSPVRSSIRPINTKSDFRLRCASDIRCERNSKRTCGRRH